MEYANLLDPIKQYLQREAARAEITFTAAVQPAKEQVDAVTRAERVGTMVFALTRVLLHFSVLIA